MSSYPLIGNYQVKSAKNSPKNISNLIINRSLYPNKRCSLIYVLHSNNLWMT